MYSKINLGGRRILVVEDDYFLAGDAADALSRAGADVLGPCNSEQTARCELDRDGVDAVVLDINLGPGASFELAAELKRRRIPFVFLTGYDRDAIPPEFADVEQLIKPTARRSIVQAASKLVAAPRTDA